MLKSWFFRKRRFALLAGAGIFSAIMYYALASRQDDVRGVQEAIRNDYSTQKGITLTNVGLVRKNDRELYGFAAFQIGLREIVKTCVASRENRNAAYVWACD
jgi:hypothetical protein